MSRHSFIRASVLIVFMAGVVVWLLHQAILPLAESGQGEMAGMEMPGTKKKEEKKPAPAKQSVGTESARVPENVPGIVTILPERLQTIGVKYGQVTRRPLEKTIRTVGRVAVDERRLAKVTIKFHGWIEELFVSALGDHVKKGQALFRIYSPDLVASQEEYLLAIQGQQQLGKSEFSEVARSSQELLEATRHRLHLWDISEEHIRDLEQTKQVKKTLPIHSPIAGSVIRKEVVQGAHVEPGQELYTIVDLSRVWILADIYEYELSFVKAGQKAAVILSYDPSTVLTARVDDCADVLPIAGSLDRRDAAHDRIQRVVLQHPPHGPAVCCQRLCVSETASCDHLLVRSENIPMDNLRRLVLVAFLAVLGFFLVTEHRAHVFGIFPYLLLFACPLFHLLLHGRHGGHDTDDQAGGKQDRPPERTGSHSHG